MLDALAEFAVARGQFGTARVELALEFALSRCRSATALSSVAVMCSSSRRSSGARELYTPRRQEGVYSIASVPLHVQRVGRKSAAHSAASITIVLRSRPVRGPHRATRPDKAP